MYWDENWGPAPWIMPSGGGGASGVIDEAVSIGEQWIQDGIQRMNEYIDQANSDGVTLTGVAAQQLIAAYGRGGGAEIDVVNGQVTSINYTNGSGSTGSWNSITGYVSAKQQMAGLNASINDEDYRTQSGTRTYVIGGADLNFSGLSATAKAIINATGGQGYNLVGGESPVTTQKVISDIKAAYTEGQAVQIYRYSLGGKVALDVARALDAADIPISLLVTIDAAEGPMSALVNRAVPGNVSVNYNFFQTTPSNIGSYGGYNSGSGLIFNYNLTGPNITHGNIDEATLNTSIFLLTH
jgi:hypothetical protein